MKPEQIRQIFGKDADEILADTDDAITVVYVGNQADKKVSMTPWIMAHRFSHSGYAERKRTNYSYWKVAKDHFFDTINSILSNMYRKTLKRNVEGYNRELESEYRALFTKIGTQRSSRMNQLRNAEEFFDELVAQYIGTGRITLNPLPTGIGYGQQAWGNPTMYMRLSPEYADDYNRKNESEKLAHDTEMMIYDALSTAVGKVFVM